MPEGTTSEADLGPLEPLETQPMLRARTLGGWGLERRKHMNIRRTSKTVTTIEALHSYPVFECFELSKIPFFDLPDGPRLPHPHRSAGWPRCAPCFPAMGHIHTCMYHVFHAICYMKCMRCLRDMRYAARIYCICGIHCISSCMF